jgi:hypothetical protein
VSNLAQVLNESLQLGRPLRCGETALEEVTVDASSARSYATARCHLLSDCTFLPT